MSYVSTGGMTTQDYWEAARKAKQAKEEAAAREQLKKPVLTEEDANKRNEAEKKLGRALTQDWRTGAPDSKLKREARKKTAEMEARRAANTPEGETSGAGGGMTTYLMLGGAALVIFLILRKKHGKK